jgi:two-component system LytT family response regulator
MVPRKTSNFALVNALSPREGGNILALAGNQDARKEQCCGALHKECDSQAFPRDGARVTKYGKAFCERENSTHHIRHALGRNESGCYSSMSYINGWLSRWLNMNPDGPDTPALQFTPKVIRTIIADEERGAREKLRTLLASEKDVKVVAECSDGKQTVSAIRRLRADLVIVEVQMPDIDGFEVLKELSPEEIPAVIFTSVCDKYALRAFEVRTLDYLLKPLDLARLHNAIEKARLELNKSQDRQITQRVLDLLSELKPEMRPSSSPDGLLVIRAKGRVVFLKVSEVDWIEASANYVRVYAGKKSHLFRESMSRILERLNPKHFVRIDHSTIVNFQQIKELIPVNSGEYIVVLKSGKELSCSRGYRATLESMIEKGL